MRTLHAALVLPLLLLAACGEATDTGDAIGTSATLPASPQPVLGPTSTDYPYDDYAFTVLITCYCPDADQPYRITVKDGKATSATYVKAGDDHQPGDVAPEWADVTLDEIIDLTHDEEAYKVDTDWPAEQAYPTSVYVDRDQMMADEEIGYEVSDVVPG